MKKIKKPNFNIFNRNKEKKESSKNSNSNEFFEYSMVKNDKDQDYHNNKHFTWQEKRVNFNTLDNEKKVNEQVNKPQAFEPLQDSFIQEDLFFEDNNFLPTDNQLLEKKIKDKSKKKKRFANDIQEHINFCKRFTKYSKIPKLRLKHLDERYKEIYKKKYQIGEDEVNRATFVVFSLIFVVFFLVLFLMLMMGFRTFNNLIFGGAFGFSLMFSLLFSFYFNQTILREINKEEKTLDAMFNFIGVDFSLIQSSAKKDSDLCLRFIELMRNYKLPISDTFKDILSKVHKGATPEKELNNIISPSDDFNKFLRNQLIDNFNVPFNLDEVEHESSEGKFKIYLKSLKSKINFIFGLGFLFPLGFCISMMLIKISGIQIFAFSLIFFLILGVLYRKLMKFDVFLIGLMHNNSNLEKRKFDEFLIFIRAFANRLKHSVSPEKAFFTAFSANKSKFNILKDVLQNHASSLSNLTYSFTHMIESLKWELHLYRCNLILDSINSMIIESAYNTSSRIKQLLQIIHKQRKLENKLDVKLKGERFRAFLFLFTIPLIVGVIGGFTPFFSYLTEFSLLNSLDSNSNLLFQGFITTANANTLPIFLSLLFTILITSYYILKVINSHKLIVFYVIISVLFTIIFFSFNFFSTEYLLGRFS